MTVLVVMTSAPSDPSLGTLSWARALGVKAVRQRLAAASRCR
jgi:hypothetical protein